MEVTMKMQPTAPGIVVRRPGWSIRLRPWLAATFGLLLAACGEKATVSGPGDRQLSIREPADQTISRGSTNNLLIMIDRQNFAGPVEIDFEDLPDGVSVANPGPIPADDTVKTFTLVAENDADLVENHQAKVVAKGPDGLEVAQFFRVTVRSES